MLRRLLFAILTLLYAWCSWCWWLKFFPGWYDDYQQGYEPLTKLMSLICFGFMYVVGAVICFWHTFIARAVPNAGAPETQRKMTRL